MECRNFLCTAKEPKQFYKFNKSTCKECICARQRLTKKTRENAERSMTETRDLNSKCKLKTPALNSELKTLNSVIASQQKMLEYQQRQTDLIISLTQKLLTINSETKERDRERDITESPRKSPLPSIPATPRKYPQFAKYKNRLE